MATQGGVSDDLLFDLAEDIETSEQMENLGRTLGFKVAEINRYVETNRMEGRVTCKGTRAMLCDWRQTVKPCDQHTTLTKALIDAKLVMLADTYNRYIYREKISESLTVQQCREKLESRYLNQLCKIQMKPWDPTDYAEFEDMHTVVTMVKKDAHGKDTLKKEILQGSVAEIFSTKVNGRLPARILISAPAGRGKTTAVAKMAYDWVHRERGSALEHLPLLFVVKFRNTSKLTSIGEAIKSQLLSDVDDLTPEGLESFIRKNQGICHIILDGLDEYAGISSSMSNIVSVIRWEEFPQCRVLVTTRPHLENFFDQDDLPRVYTKMWIEGFSRVSSREYIDKFVASTSNPHSRHGQGLKAYLDDQPLIDELVKTPLFCLMICHLWSEGLLDSDTTNQTELLNSVNVFLMHHANARSKPKVKITPRKLRKIISQLGKVALKGLLDDAKKLVFRPHDFRKVPAILDRACELGIVSKTTVYITSIPQSSETTSTTIEFYHKLAQEHSAGKFLADKTYHFLLRLKMSKLDRLLHRIQANIGDYENLIRFASGSDNTICIRIMEALLANSFLNESERYRIILDCSSETKGTEGNVSSLVHRCVNAQSIILKAPTVYTVVGMQNLPKQLKREVRSVKFEGSTLTTDVTSGLWSCLEAFSKLHTLTISDSSLSFPPSPPELLSVTKLSAEKVTSQSYEGVLSSIPGVRDIDVSIDVAETSNTFRITAASRPTSQTRARDEQFLVHIRLHACPARTTDGKFASGETIGGLSLLFEDQTKIQQRLHVSGVKGRDEEALVDLFVKTKQLTLLNSGSGGGSLNNKNAVRIDKLTIKDCRLSTEMTEELWSCLASFTRLNQLTISDSSLSFPPSPPELPYVTKLSAKRVTSQGYEGLLASLPGLRDIDFTIDDAETSNNFQITTCTASRPTSQTRDEQFFVHIRLHAWPALSTDRKIESGETIGGLSLLFRDDTKTQRRLYVSGVKGRDEQALVDLFVKTKQLTYLNSGSGGGSLNEKNAVQNTRLEIEHCHLSTEMTEKLLSSLRSFTPLNQLLISDTSLCGTGGGALNKKNSVRIDKLTIKDCHLSTKMTEELWFCLASFTRLNQLTISDSSLSFPPSPPELPYVTKLSAERVTSQIYEGVLSSITGVRDIDVTIDVTEKSNNFQITKASRPISQTWDRDEQFLVHIRLHAWPAPTTDGRMESGETIGGLSLLLEDQTKNSQRLHVSGVKGRDKKALVDLFIKTKQLTYLNSGSGDSSLNENNAVKIEMLTIKDCHLSTGMTKKLWSCVGSSTPLNHLTISDSSLSFPPSPPELPSVTKLSVERVTSQSYKGLLSSLPGLKEVDITFGDANAEGISQIQTSLHRYLKGHDLMRINPLSYSSEPEENISSISIQRMQGLGLLVTRYQAILSGVVFGPEDTAIDLVQSLTRLMSASLYEEQLCELLCQEGSDFNIALLTIKDCHLSTEITEKLWSSLASFTRLNQLTISDSSLSFPPSPPKLFSVTTLSAERMTSQRYEGLLSSLTGLRHISITIDDAERDVSQITAGLRRTGGQQLKRIKLTAASSLPLLKISVSTETMRGMGLLIREQTENLNWLGLSGVNCTDEEDLVYLTESCRGVKTMSTVWLCWCGTRKGGRLDSYLQHLQTSSRGNLRVEVSHGGASLPTSYHISHNH